jgi:signal transduction histidine kinase
VKVGEIAALDFGEPCQIKTGDELESLGNDVNLLGEKLKTTLETLRLQNEQLEKDIIAQRQFISNASHELRTPLSLIKGYADEMTAGYAPNASQKDLYISIIAEEAAKMNRLLKEMLELSRMESGHVTMQTDVFFVRERIQAFLDKYDGYIAENGLHIRVIEGKEMQGVFDPMYFEQILANYISNAGRYGDSDKRIEISVQDRGDSVRVTVFNTGEPIDEEIIEHIWDGFYKADRARTRVKDSYGLGLSIVKAIQTSAGQGYGVQNVPGGVEFWFDVKRAIHTASKE